MSYQQFSNPPAANTSTSTTVVHTGQPAVIHAPQQTTYNPFAPKAEATKKLGIAQLVIGIVVFVMGIAMIFIAPEYWGSISGGGIWSGIFIIVAGSLCMAAGSTPERYGTRCAALTFCIISLIFLSSCGLINFIAFATQINCQDYCYYDNWSGRTICDYNDCSTAGAILSLVLSILMVILFVLTVISAINTGRGCCGQGYSSGYIVTQPVLAPSGGVTVSNYQSTATSAAYPHHPYAAAPGSYQPPVSAYQQPAPGYQPPAPGYQPPASGYQPQTSSYLPPTSAYQPPMSGYQPEAHHYPGQQQQYNQAATGQIDVTYGVDYSQQKAGIPEGGIGDAPPPYNPNA